MLFDVRKTDFFFSQLIIDRLLQKLTEIQKINIKGSPS